MRSSVHFKVIKPEYWADAVAEISAKNLGKKLENLALKLYKDRPIVVRGMVAVEDVPCIWNVASEKEETTASIQDDGPGGKKSSMCDIDAFFSIKNYFWG